MRLKRSFSLVLSPRRFRLQSRAMGAVYKAMGVVYANLVIGCTVLCSGGRQVANEQGGRVLISNIACPCLPE